MKQYKFIVDYCKANEFIYEEEWFETETEAWFVYNRLNEKGAVKGHLIDGLTGEVIAEFGYDEPDEEPAPEEPEWRKSIIEGMALIKKGCGEANKDLPTNCGDCPFCKICDFVYGYADIRYDDGLWYESLVPNMWEITE